MKKGNKIYCDHCGKENDRNAKVCKFCNYKLYRRNHDLLEYLLGKRLEEIKDGFFHALLDLSTTLIKKYLYGVVIVASAAFSILSGIRYYNDQKEEPVFPNTSVYAMKELTDEEKLVGCWQVEDETIEEGTVYEKIETDLNGSRYQVLSSDIKQSSLSLISVQDFETALALDEFYAEANWPQEAVGRRFFTFEETGDNGSVIVSNGIIVWKDNNHFSFYELHDTNEGVKSYSQHTRISCRSVPR